VSVELCVVEVLGVVGKPVAVVLDERAVRGVGAPIKDFFGVSVTSFLRPPRVEEDNMPLLEDGGGFGLRPAVIKG
jgi:hypothetical protein